MYAYGLEESGEYIEAEKQAKMGLQLQRQDCWSTHAIAHCMEMASDFNNGINFLESTENDWSVCFEEENIYKNKYSILFLAV